MTQVREDDIKKRKQGGAGADVNTVLPGVAAAAKRPAIMAEKATLGGGLNSEGSPNSVPLRDWSDAVGSSRANMTTGQQGLSVNDSNFKHVSRGIAGQGTLNVMSTPAYDQTLTNRFNAQADALAAERVARNNAERLPNLNMSASWQADLNKRNADTTFRNLMEDVTRGVSPGRAAKIKADMIGERLKAEGDMRKELLTRQEAEAQSRAKFGELLMNARAEQNKQATDFQQKALLERFKQDNENSRQQSKLGLNAQLAAQRLGIDYANAQQRAMNDTNKLALDAERVLINKAKTEAAEKIGRLRALEGTVAANPGLADTTEYKALVDNILGRPGQAPAATTGNNAQPTLGPTLTKREAITLFRQKNPDRGIKNPFIDDDIDGPITKEQWESAFPNGF